MPAAPPNYTQKVPGTVQLSWGAQPDGTSGSEGNIRAGMTDRRHRSRGEHAAKGVFIQLHDADQRVLPARGERARRHPGGRPALRHDGDHQPGQRGGHEGIQSRLSLAGLQDFASNLGGATHPVRVSDEFVALDQGGDINTIAFPGETAPTVAPAPITTNDGERMPRGRRTGSHSGFVREAAGRR